MRSEVKWRVGYVNVYHGEDLMYDCALRTPITATYTVGFVT